MIKVLNKYHGHAVDEHTFNIMRPTVLRNPFTHLEGTTAEFKVSTREEAVEKFEVEIRRAIIAKEERICMALNKLYRHYLIHGELNLLCCCAPKACHGDVIKRILIEKIPNYEE